MTKEQYLKFAESEFASILELIKKKNADYTGNSNDPFQNFKTVEYMDICSVETGIMTRLSDKFSRTSSLLKKPAEVAGDSLEDSLRDIIGYSILMLGYVKSKQELKVTIPINSHNKITNADEINGTKIIPDEF